MSHQQKSVVIADDERIITTIIGQRLQHFGLAVHHARDGQHAMRLVEDVHPDLVILDVKMPKADGLEVCRMIKSRADLCDIPIIVLSGQSDSRTLRHIGELGVGYILKSSEMWNRLSDAITRIFTPDVLPADVATVSSH